MKLSLIGCGFLGSLFAEEVAKLFFAHEERLDFVFIDDDIIDQRNPANHLYTPADVDLPKVEALSARARLYGFESLSLPRRLERDSDLEMHTLTSDLIIDAVDNLPTRHLLWELGKLEENLPVLHLGVSQQGTGAVEWTLGEYDTFSLSPINLAARSPEEVAAGVELRSLRPCELVKFRGLGLNTALAGAKAAGIICGLDPTEAALPARRGTLTTWVSTNVGHSLIEVHRV